MSLPVADIQSTEQIPLISLPLGASCQVCQMDLDASVQALLMALGVSKRSSLRLCQVGNPCIVEVRGTRIGLSSDVASRLFVEPKSVAE